MGRNEMARDEMARDDASLRRAPQDSAPMLVALGIFAYAASMMTHEALGHGVYCIAAGGHNVLLTTWRETCTLSTARLGLGIKVAGPGAQFGGGLPAWVALRLSPPNAVRLRYLLWLYMAFSLLISSGYVAFSGFTDFGDAAELIAGLAPRVVWRAGLVLLGSVVYFLSQWAAALELKRFAGQDDGSRRLSRLVWVPYAAAGVFACGTGALNQTTGRGGAIGLAVASSFGAGLGLLFLPMMQRGIAARESSPTVYVDWSAAWGVVIAVAMGLFLFYIGPGLK